MRAAKLLKPRGRLKLALRLVARWRQPRLAARLLHATSNQIPGLDRGTRNASCRYRVLALSANKAGFLQDIEESFSQADDFDVIQWPTPALPFFASEILSPALNNNHYLTADPAIETSKQEYREFLLQTWRHFLRIEPVHAVLSANFHYFPQREFAAALEMAGTPFMVLHKENLKSPGRAEFWRYMYRRRGTFSGRQILAYNEIERELQISTGVTGPQGVIVTGMPRMDRLHRWRRASIGKANGSPRHQVLFFAFDRKDKLPAGQHRQAAGTAGNVPEVMDRWGELSWKHLCEKTHRAIVDLAHKRPDLRVIVKVKGVERQRTEVIEMLEASGDQLPQNLEIVISGDPFQLLIESDAVIGFNTTGLLEALAAGKPVIVPHFDEALDPRTRDFAIDLGEAVEYARSPEEVVELVCCSLDAKHAVPAELSPGAARALRQWTGNDDGAAGHRVLQAVRDAIEATGTGASASSEAPSPA